MNALLDFSGLPKFAAFSPALIAPAMAELIADANAVIEQVASATAAPSFANVITPLDDVTERVSRAWSIASHLNAVANAPDLREAYNGTLPSVTAFWSALAQDERLYAKYKQLRASSGDLQLTPTQIQVLDNEIRDFRLGGAELGPSEKARFQEIQAALSSLSARFGDHVLDATKGYAYWVEHEAELAGVPADVITTARAAAESEGRAGWKLTLHAPCYLPVMQYASHAPLRERLYRGFVTRASELGENTAWDNSAVMIEILALRKEAASLLGFNNFAEVSLATKMADSPAAVIAFLRDLSARAKPFAEKDWRELSEFARATLGISKLNAWDVAYAAEKLRQQRYAFSDQELKQYFPETQVLAGLFGVITALYGLTLTAAPAATWHTDARFYDVRQRDGTLVGQFYLDLYAREGKRGGAWMDDAINRRKLASHIQHPVAYLTCNFSAPVSGKPALFTHNEVITLFHEFGHGLHQLLTEVDELGVSGINGVEWDAVELPSQFMENFCWEWDVLQQMTRHVETGATLPRALYEKMQAAKNFQAGMGMVRQLEFALVDMRLHTDFDPAHDGLAALIASVRRDVAVVQYPEFNRVTHAFSHIFGGGYAAGYYSYKWAEVLSADAYAAFEETSAARAETGARFRREIIGRGGSRPAMESFIAFRGRKPELDALLRHNGMQLAVG